MIALEFNNTTRLPDIVRDGGNIQTDETLETSVLVSLFTRRRALDDDELPEPRTHREGWWADPYSDVEGDLIGSRLWLLNRSKATQATMNKAKSYCEEALQWLIDDGIAESVTVTVERKTPLDFRALRGVGDMLVFKVEILKPTETAGRWVGVWTAHLRDL